MTDDFSIRTVNCTHFKGDFFYIKSKKVTMKKNQFSQTFYLNTIGLFGYKKRFQYILNRYKKTRFVCDENVSFHKCSCTNRRMVERLCENYAQTARPSLVFFFFLLLLY